MSVLKYRTNSKSSVNYITSGLATARPLYEALKQSYQDFEVFGIFERVYTEHFTVVEDKVEVKPSGQLNGGTLQSPDDIDATYRKKQGRPAAAGYRDGQS
ncbi:hypothetical protein KKG48_03820 [Patescibacteria group bacterium]|nr:hypothetical protein [Patescibacteria group bacterium]